MFLLVLYLAVAVFFSFICSVLEAVLLSMPPSYVSAKLEEGSYTGRLLSRFKKKVDRPLAAILTLNTFAHTIGAAGVGAEAQKIWGNEYLSITSAVLTIIILIFSEIIPKTLGATYWRALAGPSAYVLQMLIVLLYPLVVLSQLLTRLLRKEGHEIISRGDLLALSKLSYKSGEIDQGESTIISNLIRFDQVQARDIMTPRSVIVAAQEDQSIRAYYDQVRDLPFSRIPVYSRSTDHIHGYVMKNEILDLLVKQQGEKKIGDIKRKLLTVYESISLPALFEKLNREREQIALAVDEFGVTAGLVSYEDIMETLLGIEIVDETDRIEDMQAWARKKWEERARDHGLISE